MRRKRNAPRAGSCSTRPIHRNDRSPPPTPASLQETPSRLASAGMRPSLALDPTLRFPLACARSRGGGGHRDERLRRESNYRLMANRGTRERATYLGCLVGPHPTMRTLRSKFVLGQQFFSPAYVIFSSLKPPTPTSSEPIDRCFNPRVLPNEAHDFLILFSKRQRQTSCLRRISSRGTACTISSRTIGRAKNKRKQQRQHLPRTQLCRGALRRIKHAAHLSRSWYTAATISNFLSPTPWYVALSPYVSPPNHWCTSLSDLPASLCAQQEQRLAMIASCEHFEAGEARHLEKDRGHSSSEFEVGGRAKAFGV